MDHHMFSLVIKRLAIGVNAAQSPRAMNPSAASETGASAPATTIHEPASPFPPTLWTLVRGAGDADPERMQKALDALCERYQQVIHLWFQRTRPGRMPAAVAEDWAQDFLLAMHQRNPFRHVGRQAAKFRSFLLVCMRNFLRDKLAAEKAAKRGGGAVHEEFDDAQALGAGEAPDEALDVEFARATHLRTMTRLADAWERKGHGARFKALHLCILGGAGAPSYADAAVALQLNENHVKKIVFDLREAYYDFFREEVAQTIHDRAEIEGEMRYLAGLLVRVRGP
jgi:DNA-directed RNA polymerase specialized sigma24 family protein